MTAGGNLSVSLASYSSTGEVEFGSATKDDINIFAEAAIVMLEMGKALIDILSEVGVDVTTQNEKIKELDKVAQDLRMIRDQPNITEMHSNLQDGKAIRFSYEGTELYLYSPSRTQVVNSMNGGGWNQHDGKIRRGSGNDQSPSPQVYFLNSDDGGAGAGLNADGTVKNPFGTNLSTWNERDSRIVSQWATSNMQIEGQNVDENAAPTGFYQVTYDSLMVAQTGETSAGKAERIALAESIGQGNALYITAAPGSGGERTFSFVAKAGLKKDEASKITGVQSALDDNTAAKSELTQTNQTLSTILQNLTDILSQLVELLRKTMNDLKNSNEGIANNMGR